MWNIKWCFGLILKRNIFLCAERPAKCCQLKRWVVRQRCTSWVEQWSKNELSSRVLGFNFWGHSHTYEHMCPGDRWWLRRLPSLIGSSTIGSLSQQRGFPNKPPQQIAARVSCFILPEQNVGMVHDAESVEDVVNANSNQPQHWFLSSQSNSSSPSLTDEPPHIDWLSDFRTQRPNDKLNRKLIWQIGSH